VRFLKGKDFTNTRKWVAENIDTDATAIFRTLYDTASMYVSKNSVPGLVLILANLKETSIKSLISFLKDKDFTNTRKWVAENIDTDATAIFRTLYDTASMYVDKTSIPQLVVIIGRYQYQAAFVADHEINLMACLTEMMVELEYL
jgi:replication factor C small subunit